MTDDDSRLNIDRPSLQLLAALLLDKVGLKITPDGYYGLRLALVARMPALGLFDASEYVRRLRQLAGETELRALLPLVTVGKTEFFRDSRQFGALENVIIPEKLAQARREGRKLRIWTAGCATGEEPYSVAIVSLELGAQPNEIDLWATDLNPAAVENAMKANFPTRRMVGVSEDRLAKFFVPAGESYQVAPAVKALIRFEGHNLAAPVFPMITPGSLDLIMCRNVIIYFDQPTIRGLMDRAVGGVGMRLGRRNPERLREGDALDFWRVEEIRRPDLLRLRAEMKVPGRAWLQYEVSAVDGGSRLVQTAFFEPKGVPGLAYWYLLYPIHGLIFRGTVRVLAERAQAKATAG